MIILCEVLELEDVTYSNYNDFGLLIDGCSYTRQNSDQKFKEFIVESQTASSSAVPALLHYSFHVQR